MKRLVVVACACALIAVPTTAHAQTTSERLAATRKAIDAAAQRWFAAQNSAANLDASIATLQHEITAANARVDATRQQAEQRALVMYESASTGYGDMFGSDAMDSARRAELIGHANAKNEQAIADLTTSVDELHGRQRALESQRAQLAHALRDVASERTSLDSQLNGLVAQARRDAKASAVLAAERARTAHRSAASDASAPPTRPTGSGSPVPPVAPPPPSGAVSAHHDDPFLVCTRARESNGDYQAESPDGLYYGAYQFLPSTWNVTANHANRPDLVGVSPSRASVFDQDEMAWALYQWQGKAPWGGRC